MIFVTTGTLHYNFLRLIKKIDGAKKNNLINDKVIIQYCGDMKGYKITSCEHHYVVSYFKFIDLVKNCRIYICHGGIGSIITGLFYGKVPVVVPRLLKYKEHVDDHQIEVCKEFEKRKMVIVCYDLEYIIDIISNYEFYIKNISHNIYSNIEKKEFFEFLKNIIEN